jgi:hypothetical protein
VSGAFTMPDHPPILPPLAVSNGSLGNPIPVWLLILSDYQMVIIDQLIVI